MAEKKKKTTAKKKSATKKKTAVKKAIKKPVAKKTAVKKRSVAKNPATKKKKVTTKKKSAVKKVSRKKKKAAVKRIVKKTTAKKKTTSPKKSASSGKVKAKKSTAKKKAPLEPVVEPTIATEQPVAAPSQPIATPERTPDVTVHSQPIVTIHDKPRTDKSMLWIAVITVTVVIGVLWIYSLQFTLPFNADRGITLNESNPRVEEFFTSVQNDWSDFENSADSFENLIGDTLIEDTTVNSNTNASEVITSQEPIGAPSTDELNDLFSDSN